MSTPDNNQQPTQPREPQGELPIFPERMPQSRYLVPEEQQLPPPIWPLPKGMTPEEAGDLSIESLSATDQRVVSPVSANEVTDAQRIINSLRKRFIVGGLRYRDLDTGKIEEEIRKVKDEVVKGPPKKRSLMDARGHATTKVGKVIAGIIEGHLKNHPNQEDLLVRSVLEKDVYDAIKGSNPVQILYNGAIRLLDSPPGRFLKRWIVVIGDAVDMIEVVSKLVFPKKDVFGKWHREALMFGPRLLGAFLPIVTSDDI